ncbi:MAG: DUF4157 domain-containing protein [Fischerella sp. CENA71]|nr:DUF4157 domain-containing protein [Fischerella sp. CENA71]
MYRKQISQKASPSLRSTPKSQDIAPSPTYGSLSAVVQRAQQDPNSVSGDERQQLESAIGTRSTREILAGKQTPWVPQFQGISAQLWGNAGQVGTPIQAKGKDDITVSKMQPENKTGLPDHLKAGIENLSGIAMDDVRVHYNSAKPAELQALAYTQGTDIHVAPGQEKHLPHEAWHVVQQKQGRVKPTIQAKNVGINDDGRLETEADVMGAKTGEVQHKWIAHELNHVIQQKGSTVQRQNSKDTVVQRVEKKVKKGELVPSYWTLNQEKSNSDKEFDYYEDHADEVGLVPPTTHGRSQDFRTPAEPQKTKGQRHLVPRKKLTRSERMIDRIGRILATETNVHVAVALDDQALVLSANKENPNRSESLVNMAGKLKDIVKNIDPLQGTTENLRIPKNKRDSDLKKVKYLLNDEYTKEKTGIELNEEVRGQLIRIKNAIDAGVINKTKYLNGDPGIYVIQTPSLDSEEKHNMHGELKVTEAIKERRQKNEYQEKNVYIGGTLADCFACNAAHKIMNETIVETTKDWSFYSGGTHGGMFVGYRTAKHITSKRFQTLTGEEIEGKSEKIPKVNVNIDPGGGKDSYADDSGSEDETYTKTKSFTKKFRQLKLIEKDIQDQQKQLTKTHQQITNQRSELDKLQEECKAAKLHLPEYEKQLKQLAEEIDQSRLSFLRAIKILEDRDVQLQKMTKTLEEAKTKITTHSELAGTVRKPKTPPPLIYDNEGNVYHGNYNKGKAPNFLQEPIDKAVKASGYKDAFQAHKTAPEEQIKSQAAVDKISQELNQLELTIQEIKAKIMRIDELPALIKNKTIEIEKYSNIAEELSKEVSQNQNVAKLQAEKDTKDEAAKLKDQPALTKLDWLNEKVIKDFQ